MRRARRVPGASIDWADVHQRLENAQRATNEGEISPERARAILDERARVLARKSTESQSAGERVEVLTFVLGAERYAIETRYVREVVRMVDFTRVPGAPGFVLGVTNYRGDVLCVIDLRPFLQAAPKGLTDLSRIIVLGTDVVEFGILADQTDAVQPLPLSEILPVGHVHAHAGREYLRGVTRNALSVLDGRSLLDDPRLVIDQHQVGST